MPYRLLWVVLEGDDDLDFYQYVLEPLLRDKTYWDWIKPWRYAGETLEDRGNFINSVNAMEADYMILCDINTHPCKTSKKDRLKQHDFDGRIVEDKIIVVIKEIESWYLAGLDNRSMSKVGIRKRDLRRLQTTDGITKEDFDDLIPHDKTRKEFKLDILENYNVDVSKRKNESFRYFLNKWINNGQGTS